jgi:hypothetical protein
VRKGLSTYGVTGWHGPSRGLWPRCERRATKRYFHKVTNTSRQIKARRKQSRKRWRRRRG